MGRGGVRTVFDSTRRHRLVRETRSRDSEGAAVCGRRRVWRRAREGGYGLAAACSPHGRRRSRAVREKLRLENACAEWGVRLKKIGHEDVESELTFHMPNKASAFLCTVDPKSVPFLCTMEAAKAEESPALVRELSIQSLRVLSKCLLFLSTLSSHPLFSVLTSASLLAVLYLPRPLLLLLLSPVSISTLLLLAALFHLGSPPRKPPVSVASAVDDAEDIASLHPEPMPEFKVEPVGFHQKMIFCDAFNDWGRRTAPLEVIYEEYEREGDEDVEDAAGGGWPRWLEYPEMDGGRLRPFEFAYVDSDTESESGSLEEEAGAERWSSPEEIRLRWEEEEEGEDMIEIELEEENLIEIDISGGR
ncbi:hypothetical protein Cni_G00599 [Canna indica]|uniref:Uncharacterized protein n=1 Tax=Canna indica TaxID=4628 RepID=A0AAQ3JLA7_9LILI|nr:hypothetical protein Cni_G00599 [Canna indica]